MPAQNPIDRACRRHLILKSMLQHHRSMANSPVYHRNLIKLGFLEEGEVYSDAVKIIDKTFDELFGLISHLAIIDMTAALELAAKPRIGNACGALRKAYKDHKVKSKNVVYANNLIISPEDFNTLKSLLLLVEGFVDKDIVDAFEATRTARNNFAHGTNVTTMPIIDVENARNVLNDIFDIL